MIHFEEEALIQSPIEKVYALLADPSRIPQWRTDVPNVTDIQTSNGRLISFNEEVNFMGRKKLSMEVKDAIPNNKLVYVATSGMPLLPRQTFTLSEQGNSTIVRIAVDMSTNGIFSLLGPLLKGKLRKTWKAYFVSLNSLLK